MNFDEPIWINCEISSIKASKGSHYLDLTQKDPDTEEIIANASGVIWYKSYLFIKRKLGELTDSILEDGSQVKIKVKVEFTEKYGFKLVIEDVDPSHTLGVHELTKRKTFEKLKAEGALDVNNQLELPQVFQNIAVISSKTAAGFEDFKSQLSENAYGYQFSYTLFEAAVQGSRMESDFIRELKKIEKAHKDFDSIVLIRGGGSRLDLSGFDSYKISKQISKMSLPVIVGVGHEIDQTIADLVAHTSLKTPTAVANFIIDHNASFESEVLQTWEDIKHLSQMKVLGIKEQLNLLSAGLQNMASQYIQDQRRMIESMYEDIIATVKNEISESHLKLRYSKKILKNAHPEEILKKGFAIIHQSGKIVTRKKSLKVKEAIEVEFSDGKQILNQNNGKEGS